ncbi:MAG: phosphoglucosamine mutase [Thermoanaerobaculaceae bacterium]
MTGRLFGTDGMRGVALEYPLDRPTLTRLGAALMTHLREAALPPVVLLAGDTRASTPVLADWLGGSFVAAGGEVHWGGVLPTPAVSHLLRDRGGYGAGVVISASHNPAADNGVKLVNRAGTKWPVEEERRLEARLAAMPADVAVAPLPPVDPEARGRYIELLLASLPAGALEGVRVVIDPANGAASPVAGAFFEALGASVKLIHAEPDGRNINARCGALFPELLAIEVRRLGFDAGVALDGDSDRAILVTRTGRVLDGDDALLVWARALLAEGRLPGPTVVATVMSNLGLEAALRHQAVTLVRCPVGDREVWEAMQREGAALGGEQSGHVICSHLSVTGDGLLTAAHLLAVARRTGTPLEELADLQRFPQVLLNVRVATRRPVEEVPELAVAVRSAQMQLSDNGRVFVRYSGTEPLLRIMVEAEEDTLARETAEGIAAVAREQLGSA